MPRRPLAATIVQNSAGADRDGNLRRLEHRLAATPPGDLLVLPEVFAFRGSDAGYRSQAESLSGPLVRRLSGWAARRREWILAGSLLEKSGGRTFNTSVLLDRTGAVAAVYRKLHLFEAHLPGGRTVRESDLYRAGDRPVMARIEDWRCGLAICYDLRFPELFRAYAGGGAHLFLVPSNFTQRTGPMHWETLLRARAIENQAFVLAPNQCGVNPATGIASYGHSLAVGPWGEVLARAGSGETVLRARLDPAALARVRARIPALRHRRPALWRAGRPRAV